MMIDLDMPHTVFVIVAKDVRGFKRGFEKCVNARFYLDMAEAIDALRAMSPDHMRYHYRVAEAVIGWPADAP